MALLLADSDALNHSPRRLLRAAVNDRRAGTRLRDAAVGPPSLLSYHIVVAERLVISNAPL